MPRSNKGPHLWRRPARRKNRRIIGAAVWIIKDSGRHFATGCTSDPTERRPPKQAEEALAQYIAAKYQALREQRNVATIDIADVLSIYYQDTRDRQSSQSRFA